MDLVGAWLRQLFKAGTAAALVPAAMLAALVAVLVGAGGFGGLGAIGQLLTGPQVSRAEQLAARDGAGARDVAPVAPADARDAPPAVGPPSSSTPAGTPRTPAAPQRPRRPAIDPRDPPTVRAPPAPVLAPPAPPPPPLVARRRPTLKEHAQVLGAKLKETVEDVGTAVREIVVELVQTLDG